MGGQTHVTPQADEQQPKENDPVENRPQVEEPKPLVVPEEVKKPED